MMGNSANEQKSLMRRLLDVLPAGAYAMHRFLDFVDVVVDEVSPTACVEAGPQPRLHLNAKFIETHCQTDEHLFLLVMHEIYHLMLGHSSQYPRITEAQNIAFDAIINAMLCHAFPAPKYVSFFQNLNGIGHTVPRLLRPPPGWAEQSMNARAAVRVRDIPGLYGVRGMSTQERSVLCRLYYKNPPGVTAQEIASLLEKAAGKQGAVPEHVLLGDHGRPYGQGADSACSGRRGDCDAAALADRLMKSIVRDTADNWAKSWKGRGLGGAIEGTRLPVARDPRREFLMALRRMLQNAGVYNSAGCRTFRWGSVVQAVETRTAVPDWRDRHAAAKELIFGTPPLMFQSSIKQTRRRWLPTSESHVYLDISGSMAGELPWLVGALNPLEIAGHCRVFVFSTVVDAARRGRLLLDRLETTGGTDINCVFKHVLSLPKAKTPARVVVLTDGYTGRPAEDLAAQFRKRGLRLYVGLVGDNVNDLLRPYAKRIETLPPCYPESA